MTLIRLVSVNDERAADSRSVEDHTGRKQLLRNLDESKRLCRDCAARPSKGIVDRQKFRVI